MKKKIIIILSSLVAVCALGLIASLFIDWPIDFNDTSGDIAKSARFSRKQATEKITNMEELINNDQAYKDGILTAYVVMQTRTVQFGTLVDMSNEVAGNIPEFAEVLKDMNEARELANNVNATLTDAGEDLNAVLSGEECPDLTQSTMNASLGYTILQKQNTLANRFIDTTDKYLEKADGDDRLKFVRDQWVDYQTMTAALENDNESAEALAKKGSLLSAEKTLSAMETFTVANQISIMGNLKMSEDMGVRTNLMNAIPLQALSNVNPYTLSATASTMVQNGASSNLQSNMHVLELCSVIQTELANNAQQNLSNNAQQNLANNAQQALANNAQQALANNAQQALANNAQQNLANSAQQNLANNAQQNLANSAQQNLANNAQQSLANGHGPKILPNNVKEALANNAMQALANNAMQALANNAQQALANNAQQNLANNAQQNLANNAQQNLANNAQQNLANNAQQNLANNAQQNLANNAQQALANNAQQNLCNQVNVFINATSLGNRPNVSSNLE